VITEQANVIPTESSPCRFTPTVMNNGSGDWWIYGEDDENYYYFTGSAEKPYVAMPKVNALDCTGFNTKTTHLVHFLVWMHQPPTTTTKPFVRLPPSPPGRSAA